jgi:hypothetical protein
MNFNEHTKYVIDAPVVVDGVAGIYAHFSGQQNPHNPTMNHLELRKEWGPVKVIQLFSAAAMNAYSRVFGKDHLAWADPEATVLVVDHANLGVARIIFSEAQFELTARMHPLGKPCSPDNLGDFINIVSGLGAFLAPDFMKGLKSVKGPHAQTILQSLAKLAAAVPEFRDAFKAHIGRVRDPSIPSGGNFLVPVRSRPLGDPGVVATSEPPRPSSNGGAERRQGAGIRLVINHGHPVTS